jgi:hypothetical protein
VDWRAAQAANAQPSLRQAKNSAFSRQTYIDLPFASPFKIQAKIRVFLDFIGILADPREAQRGKVTDRR